MDIETRTEEIEARDYLDKQESSKGFHAFRNTPYYKGVESLLAMMLTLLIYVSVSAQSDDTAFSRLEFELLQDSKFAFIGDDKGNNAFTPDLKFRFNMHGKQQELGYMVIGWEAEWADLKGGAYKKYSVNLGYRFNKVDLVIPKIWFIPKTTIRNLEATAFGSFGLIDRWSKSFGVLGISGTIGYNPKVLIIQDFLFIDYLKLDLTNFKILLVGEFVQRKDKDYAYGNGADYTIDGILADFSSFFGVSYTVTFN